MMDIFEEAEKRFQELMAEPNVDPRLKYRAKLLRTSSEGRDRADYYLLTARTDKMRKVWEHIRTLRYAHRRKVLDRLRNMMEEQNDLP